ncbi:unannotated protein [freshwater metagenome]|uniref:Unannotated protein n=1 Tax=freshwater metagenome TaxID=449393 RepID=A0A6J7FF80_9ZZZZ|nr:hypothetical protein [Actinomycetota bacterium]
MTSLAIPTAELEQMKGLASLLPGEAPELFAKMIFGRGLGMGPAQSLSQIDFVKGKCELTANAQASRMRAYVGPWGERYDYEVVDLTNEICTLRFWRRWPADRDRDDELLGESSFSMDDAKTAGIANGMYAKYARNMLLSRAMSNGVAWFAPETTYGVRVYAIGEMDPSRDHAVPELPAGDEPTAPVVEAPDDASRQIEQAPTELPTQAAQEAREPAPAAPPAEKQPEPAQKAAPAATDELKRAFKELRARGNAKNFGNAQYHALLTDAGVPENNDLGARMRAATQEQVVQMIANTEFLDAVQPEGQQQTIDGTADELPAQAPAEGVLA